MAETKQITSLYVVTDTETNQEKIGDIDGGGFDQLWLDSHIKRYGSAGLLEKIAWMTYQVVDAQRRCNLEGQADYVTAVS